MSSGTENAGTMALPINQISWTEIPCTDLDRAGKFYSTVFDWTVGPTPPPPTADGQPQLVMFTKDTMHGCFLKVDAKNLLTPATLSADKSQVGVRVTITVEDMEQALGKVKAAGGQIYIPKREIPNNMGVVAYFLDPEKNVMGLWAMK